MAGVLVVLTEAEREALARAAAGERRVRHWRRYQALLLLGVGQRPVAVAATLGCARSSVYAWAVAWARDGVAGVQPVPPQGRQRLLARDGGAGERAVQTLLTYDPHARGHLATGWTVPLLQTELANAGHLVSARTLRRTLHRLGWRWKRPKYVLGRPDPHYAEKSGGERASAGRARCGRRGVGG